MGQGNKKGGHQEGFALEQGISAQPATMFTLPGGVVDSVSGRVLVCEGGCQLAPAWWGPAGVAGRWRGHPGGLPARRRGHVPSHQHLPSVPQREGLRLPLWPLSLVLGGTLLPPPVFRVPQRLPVRCLERPTSHAACSRTVAHSTGEPGTAGRWRTQQAQSHGPSGDMDLAQDLCGVCTIKHFYSVSWSRSQEQLLRCRWTSSDLEPWSDLFRRGCRSLGQCLEIPGSWKFVLYTQRSAQRDREGLLPGPGVWAKDPHKLQQPEALWWARPARHKGPTAWAACWSLGLWPRCGSISLLLYGGSWGGFTPGACCQVPAWKGLCERDSEDWDVRV